MGICPYDVDKANIKLLGDVSLDSEGTMITVSNISSLSTPDFLNKGVALLGDTAKGKVKELLKNSNLSHLLTSAVSGGVGGLVEAGGKFIVKKLFGRSSTQTYTSDIKISTDGTFKISGEAVSVQPTNISPISHLMLPGSTPTIEDYFLPSYSKPMGVWTLESAPEVKYTPYRWIYSLLPQELVFDQGKNTLTCCMAERTVYVPQKPKVVINPAILPYIESYDVEYKLFFECSYDYYNGNVRRSCPLGIYDRVISENNPSGNNKYCGYPYYDNSVDSLYLIGGDKLVTQMVENELSTFDRQWALQYLEYPGIPQYSGMVDFAGNDDVKMRVVVTIYPKAPYNTDPIVTARTFRPKFVLDSKL